MTKVTAIILAAGMSRRMGTNKLILNYHGKPMFQHVLDTIKQSKVDEIIVVSSEISINKITALIGSEVSIINNTDYETGMTSSIQKGVEKATPNNGLMICLSDQPLITVSDYNRLIDTYKEGFQKDDKVIVVPFIGKKKGNPVIFSSMYREAILKHEEPEGCKGIIQDNIAHITKVNFNNDAMLTDVDTPESYQEIIGKK